GRCSRRSGGVRPGAPRSRSEGASVATSAARRPRLVRRADEVLSRGDAGANSRLARVVRDPRSAARGRARAGRGDAWAGGGHGDRRNNSDGPVDRAAASEAGWGNKTTNTNTHTTT